MSTGAYVPSAAAMTMSTYDTPPAAAGGGEGNRPIPPNAPPGGRWVRVKYAGGKTWGICCGFGCCLILLGGLTSPGLAQSCQQCCPCDEKWDEKEAYMSPSGVIFDEKGHAMGSKYTVI